MGEIYKKIDICRIVHLTDMDGVFVPDNAVVEDNMMADGAPPHYTETQIQTPNRVGILDRNKRKRKNVDRLSACPRIAGIPYRTLYSIFDRIAFLLNAYLKLGVVEQKVNFDSIWSRLKEKEAKNIALSALHWIDRDFKEKFGNAGAPHTKKIKMLRNALEHKFVSVHMFSTENEVKIGKDYIYRISEENLIECTMDLLQLIREAVIELTIAIRIEEKQRNPSEKKVLQMSMMEYLDEFKI